MEINKLHLFYTVVAANCRTYSQSKTWRTDFTGCVCHMLFPSQVVINTDALEFCRMYFLMANQ